MSVIFTKEKKKRTLLTGLLALLVMALMAMPAFAQAPAPDDETYHIAKKLNCPTCAGRNLADCPTDTCTQWKNEIRAQLDQGKSSEEVVDYFEARFGSTVLQEPPKEGSTAILWAAPVGAAVVFFIGAIIVMMRVSKRNTPAMAAATPAPASADPFVSQLEEDVKKSA